jgi:hypothetical protein
MDHFLVTAKGPLFQSRGKASVDLLYSVGTLFCDHATGFIAVYYHVHKNVSETLETKQRFEHDMFQHGVIVQKYHRDNGIFAAHYLLPILKTIVNPFDSVAQVPIIKMVLLTGLLEQYFRLYVRFDSCCN